jgi:hypothetical protein
MARHLAEFLAEQAEAQPPAAPDCLLTMTG